MYAVRGGRRDPRRHRARFRNAFLEQLAVLRLAIVEHRARILRIVQLAERRVNADLPEERVHPERPRLVRNDRHDARSERLVAQQAAEEPHERDRGRHLFPLGVQRERRDFFERRHGERRRVRRSRGQIPAERRAPRVQVAPFGALVGEAVEAHLREVVVRER